jgi:hypothetical protein
VVTRYFLYARAEYEAAYQQVYAGISQSFRLSSEQFPSLLRSGFSYQFQVQSANAAGLSAFSAASSLLLVAEVPSSPRSISLVSRSSTSLRIRWAAPVDNGGIELLGYNVYVAEADQAYSQVSAASSSSDPTVLEYEHTVTQTTVGAPKIYKFRVAAHNIIGEGESAQLRTGQALVGDAVDYVYAADLPESPQNPPTVDSHTETTISLTLGTLGSAEDGGAAVTAYLVEIDDGLAGSAASPGARTFQRVHDSSVTTLIISNLVGGRTYAIRYAARNIVYDSGNMFDCDGIRWSSLVIVHTAVAPAAPLNLRQADAADGSGKPLRFRDKIALEWDAVSGEGLGSSQLQGYTLAVTDLDASTPTETSTSLAAQAVSYTFESLTPGRRYSFRIKAGNLVGESPWSNSTEELKPGVEPTRPGQITFTGTTRTSITYSFNGVTGQDTGGTDALPITTTYRVYMSLNETNDYQLLASPTATGTQLADYLTPGVWYYFKY